MRSLFFYCFFKKRCYLIYVFVGRSMKNKKIGLLLISSACIFSQIHAEDFRGGNTNPFAHYVYQSEQAWQQTTQKNTAPTQPPTYFSNTIVNPISLNRKYSNLVANSQSLNGCWDKAGTAYGLDPWLLFSIAKVESSFNSRAINSNKNRSYDVGLMQINSSWFPTLSKFGISPNDLFDPCTSVFVGAWIVAQNIKHFGYNQDGIGAYNSPGNIVIRRNYAQHVYQAYRELTQDFHPTYLQVNNQ